MPLGEEDEEIEDVRLYLDDSHVEYRSVGCRRAAVQAAVQRAGGGAAARRRPDLGIT